MNPVYREGGASRFIVVIPAYNEGSHIGSVIRGALEFVPHVLVVDDGSCDETADEARRAGAEVLRHPQNYGKGAAVLTGLKAVSIEVATGVILMDGDGQHRPEDLPLLLREPLAYEFVLGNRMHDVATMPRVRRVTNRAMSAILSAATGQSITDSQCGFRRIHRRLFPLLFNARSRRFDFVSETLLIVAAAGVQIRSVPVSTVYGQQRSSIRPLTDTARFLRLMMAELMTIRRRPSLDIEHPVDALAGVPESDPRSTGA